MKTLLILAIFTSLLYKTCAYPSKVQKKGYLLSIDREKIGKARDSVVRGIPYAFVLLPVELSNYSNDTLKYVSMTCSWDMIFTIDKKAVSIKGWGCDSNIPTVSIIPPLKSYTYNISLLIQKNAFNGSYNLKIGMYLFKYSGSFKSFENFLLSDRKSSDNLIWSNNITIPK